jgi:hypothetical protein
MENEIDQKDLLKELGKEIKSGKDWGMYLSLEALWYFYFGDKEGNSFHEGLYATHNCERSQEEDIHIFCSQYLLDREFEFAAIDTLDDLRVFTKELQDNLKKEFGVG